MIKTAEELNVKVSKARLLTRAELEEHQSKLPYVSSMFVWWLGDVSDDGFSDEEIAYAEGNYSDEDMFCSKDEANTHLRVALDIDSQLEAGEEFAYKGFVFTALANNLAISNNFLGCAKYYDSEIAEFAVDEVNCTLDLIIGNLFGI